MTTQAQTSSALRKAGLFYLVFVMFSYTTGGPFGLEDMVTTSGPGMTLLYLLVLPFFWCIPVSLVSAELTTAMPVEGGFYRWTRAAFGDFWGFLAGWWNWTASFLLGGAYAVLFTDYLVYYFPKMTWWEHYLVSVALIAILTWINVRGIKQASWAVNVLTVGKLVPLAVFIAVGLAFIQPARLTTLPPITLQQSLAAGLLLIFIYGGYEVVPVPAGESVDPRRDIPFAMVATIVSVMIVMTLTQIVAQGVLPDLAGHATPIADAAAAFMGATGALLIGVGSVISMTGNNASQVLSGSRMLYALAEQGQLPQFLARIHPRYRTPANAILFTSAVALTLALSGSFAQIAVVSALARLLMYAGSAAATLRLRSADLVNHVKPAGFRAPLGPAMPIAAMAVCAGLAAGATRQQLLGGLVALGIGALLFAFQVWRSRFSGTTPAVAR